MMAAVLVASYLVVRTDSRSEFDIQLSDGAVWLSSTALGGVSLLDGGSGTIVASLGVASPGDDFSVEQWGSDAIIVNRTDGTVSRLDGSGWTIATGRVQFGDAGQQLDVVTGDDDGWVMSPGQAVALGFEDLSGSAPIPIAAPFADGAITTEGDLLYSSTDPNLELQRFPSDGGDPQPIAALSGPTVLADIGQNIAGIDLDDFQVWTEDSGVTCDRLEFPEGAVVHGGGSDGRLIAVSDQGGAFIWDPALGCPGADDFIDLGPGAYGNPTVTEGWAVIPETSRSELLVIDIDERTLISVQAIDGVEPGTEVDLIAEGGSIWYNDPTSASAGLIQPDGTIIAVAKYEDGVDGFAAAPLDDAESDDEADLGVINPESQQTSDEPEDADVAAPTTAPTTTEAAEGLDDDGADQTTTEVTIAPRGPTITTPSTTEPDVSETTDPDTDGQDDDDQASSTTEGSTTIPDDEDDEEDPNDTSETTDTTEDTEEPEPEPEGVSITMGVSASQIVAGETINFTAVTQHGSPNNWESDVSPAGPSLQALETFGSFRYLFPNAGTFFVSITACDQERNCDTGRVQVEVTEDPDQIDLIAAFTGPTTAAVGENVSFTDASQGEPDSYQWDFGPGATPATSSDANPSVSWGTDGTKTVSLTVTEGSSSDTFTSQVQVEESGPVCPDVVVSPIITGPSEIGTDESGTFTDQITPDECTGNPTYSWSATGGATISNASSRTTAIEWPSGGTYQVRLEWTNGDGFQADTFTVTVTEAPFDTVTPSAPSIVINGPRSLEEGETGTYTVTNSGGPIDSYSWTTDDGGGSSSGTSLQAVWAANGRKGIFLTVTGVGGIATAIFETDVFTAEVEQPQPFGMTCDRSEAVVDAIFNCDLTTGDPANFSSPSWSVAGGLSWLMNPWSYDAAGTTVGSTVTVTLTAVDNATGETVSSSANVSIIAAPTTTTSVPALGLSCSPSSRPADGTSAATCAISNGSEFSDISYSVSNPQGLALNQWGSPGETYIASFDPGSVTVSATATHIATGTPVSAGGAAITFSTVETTTTTEAPPAPAPMSVGCTVGSATVGQRFTCNLTSGNQGAFSGPSWSIAPGGTLSWGGGGTFTIDVQGVAAGTVTVQLVATDIATGQAVSASVSIAITE